MSARSCHQSGCHYQVLNMCHPPFSFSVKILSNQNQSCIHKQKEEEEDDDDDHRRNKSWDRLLLNNLKFISINTHNHIFLPVHAYTVTQSQTKNHRQNMGRFGIFYTHYVAHKTRSVVEIMTSMGSFLYKGIR